MEFRRVLFRSPARHMRLKHSGCRVAPDTADAGTAVPAGSTPARRRPYSRCWFSQVAAMSKSRSEERRSGKECLSTCKFRWLPYLTKKEEYIKSYKYPRHN